MVANKNLYCTSCLPFISQANKSTLFTSAENLPVRRLTNPKLNDKSRITFGKDDVQNKDHLAIWNSPPLAMLADDNLLQDWPTFEISLCDVKICAASSIRLDVHCATATNYWLPRTRVTKSPAETVTVVNETSKGICQIVHKIRMVSPTTGISFLSFESASRRQLYNIVRRFICKKR